MSTSSEIKTLSFENKIDYFKKIFSNMDNENTCDILNIFRLVNSYNTFDNDFFEHEDSYISDITEFIDIKLALEDDINNFSLELVKWYLSILANCDVKAVSESEEKESVEIPLTIVGFFANCTIPIMSAIMKSVDLSLIDMGNLYKPKTLLCLNITSNMFNQQSFVFKLLDILKDSNLENN